MNLLSKISKTKYVSSSSRALRDERHIHILSNEAHCNKISLYNKMLMNRFNPAVKDKQVSLYVFYILQREFKKLTKGW